MTDSRLSFLLQLVIDDDPLLLTSPNSFSIKLNRLPLEDFILSFKSSTSYSSSPSSSESSFLFFSLWLPWPSMLWITATLSGFNKKKDKRSLYRGELEREGWRQGCARCKLRRKLRTVKCELLFQRDHEGNMVSDTTLENGGFGDFETKFLERIVVDDDWVAW